jgi:metal-responsive CopG/Arc/MetJ family transcriptional regulator
MKRTTIALPDELAMALDREAKRRHASFSEITRAALARHRGIGEDSAHKLSFAGLGHSGHRTTARDMEKLMQREWDDLPRVAHHREAFELLP